MSQHDPVNQLPGFRPCVFLPVCLSVCDAAALSGACHGRVMTSTAAVVVSAAAADDARSAPCRRPAEHTLLMHLLERRPFN